MQINIPSYLLSLHLRNRRSVQGAKQRIRQRRRLLTTSISTTASSMHVLEKGSLSVTKANYRGVNAYKTVMTLNTSGLAGNIYTVNDTLTSYVDKDLRPLLFTKEAAEGKVIRWSVRHTAIRTTSAIRAVRTGTVKSGSMKQLTRGVVPTILSVLSYVRKRQTTHRHESGGQSLYPVYLREATGTDVCQLPGHFIGRKQ